MKFGIILVVNVCGNSLEPLGAYNELNMCRPKQRASSFSQQPSCRAVTRYKVTPRHNCSVIDATIPIRAKLASQIVLGLQIGLLVLVEALRVRLPGYNYCGRNWLSVEVNNAKRDTKRVSDAIERNFTADRSLWCIGPENGPRIVFESPFWGVAN